jgi:50S ribosomal protein L16 3-hydroxylase
MDVTRPLALLGGLSAQTFMRRHWQKKPLLVRQALPGVVSPVGRAEAFALAARDGVESRLVVRDVALPNRWTLRHGPVSRRALPPLKQPGWTLLVQGLDHHVPAAREMLEQFRFAPDARLDDLMISYATDGGGVGPHLDSYDVFLIQVQGKRRWRIGRVPDARLVSDVPLKILRNFRPEQEWVLEPGDLLYLPPLWGHDGSAVGECMTCSVGFRAATASELAADVLTRVADGAHDDAESPLYTDPEQPATAEPGRIPARLQAFAASAVERQLRSRASLHTALGETLTEPKATVWFEPGIELPPDAAVRLDAQSRMMYDDHHVYLNGESYRASGRDAKLMRQLADRRMLAPAQRRQLSAEGRRLVDEWAASGWLASGVAQG